MHGQAMTEFAIAAATVLVPLFLILPVLTKYIDVSLSSVEMARYVAWERTVWHEYGNLPAGMDTSGTVPEKDQSEIEQEAALRFLSNDEGIESGTGKTLTQSNLKPFWITRANPSSGQPEYLVKVDNVNVNMEKLKETPGIGYEVLRIFSSILQPIYQLFSWLGSHSNFDPNLDGYVNNEDNPIVSITTQPVPHVVPEEYRNSPDVASLANTTLTFKADSALLVDTWSAQGAEMFKNQTGGLVPSSFLHNDVLDTMRDVLATIFLEPKLKQPAPGKSDGWDMGGFNTDPFKFEEHSCDGNGVCSYAE